MKNIASSNVLWFLSQNSVATESLIYFQIANAWGQM